jgi:hypothetical protein
MKTPLHLKEFCMKTNKLFLIGVSIMVLILGLAVIGCESLSHHTHTQSVRNETGLTVREVYIRDTGTTDWGNVRNVQARKDSNGKVIYRQLPDSTVTVAYWDRIDINNGTELVFFESRGGETPRGISNKDIAVRDSNGLLYMKLNVPIIFTTTLVPLFGEKTVIYKSIPITFTVQDRLPGLIIVNQTGYGVSITAPVNQIVSDGNTTFWQNLDQIHNVTVTYRISHTQYTEQVTMDNEDVIVTLTRRPPYATIVNDTGNTINLVQIRVTSDANWLNQNILGLSLNDDGTVNTSNASTNANERSGSIVNRDSFRFWLGMVNLNSDRYDIRVDDVQGNSYVKTNVQITSDMILTFTQSDRR